MANTIIVNEVLEASKGTLVVVVDAKTILDDIQRYKDKLMQARGIPFDIEDLVPTDGIVGVASRQMSWASPSEVIKAVRQHYQKLESIAKNDAAVLAITKTSKLSFDPEPYPVREESAEEWDTDLPDPVRNLSNPVERRYKQVIEVIGSDIPVATRFWSIMETLAVLAERESRRIDEDGFRIERTGGDLPKKTKSQNKDG